MAQKQLDVHGKRKYFMVAVTPTLSIKVWKKGKEGTYMTFMKKHTTLGFTISLEDFKQLVSAQDTLLLASDFMRGLVGFSPEDVLDQSDVCGTQHMDVTDQSDMCGTQQDMDVADQSDVCDTQQMDVADQSDVCDTKQMDAQ